MGIRCGLPGVNSLFLIAGMERRVNMIVYKAIEEDSASHCDTFIIEIEVKPEDLIFYLHNSLYEADEYYIEPGKGKIISIYEKWRLYFKDEITSRKTRKSSYYIPRTYKVGETVDFQTWVWLKRKTAYIYNMSINARKWVKKSGALKKLNGVEKWCQPGPLWSGRAGAVLSVSGVLLAVIGPGLSGQRCGSWPEIV